MNNITWPAVLQASGASSSTLAPHKHEVFLSFRGEDTRYGFVSHLYTALVRKGIKTYIDDKSLERGNQIACSLKQAIQESKASIIVFSKNYASSSWCLDELVHILRCKERHGQIVVPVFYRVEPTHVRKQKGRFGKAFSALEVRLAGSVNKKVINKWRTALSTAAHLSGYTLCRTSSEADMVEEIVDHVKKRWNGMLQPSIDFKGDLVGIEERIDKIESLMLFPSIHDVRTIGIWGMGGIGKTTLATAVFKKFSSQFEGCCFLENVREEWVNKRERENLKKKFHLGLMGEEKPYNVRDRLLNKKVLIVLDDINDQDQLQFLVGKCSGFGSGSRIIVTTRDMQILRYLEADDAIYEVDKLNDTEALQLFILKAFKGQSFEADPYTKISKEVVNYAKGIPLALEVLGSLLRCRIKEEWQSYLNQLKEEPNDKIQNVLKVSYDGLNRKDRSIFLDIASFFKGRRRDTAEEILDACYDSPNFSAETRISNLIEKALISVGKYEILWIHDLVQEMAREIVSSNIEPGKRTRLWNAEAICDVLKNNSGTETIEGICLYLDSHIEKMEFSSSAFEGMHNLRFLEITEMAGSNAVFPRRLLSLPNALRYLRWYGCSLESFPENFTPQNLVELNMTDCQPKQLWNGVQNFKNLRHIKLRWMWHLTRIPDLSCAPKLESININYCSSLVEVPQLNFQVFEDQTTRKKFRKDLGTLNIMYCSRLKYIPNISGNVKRLDLTACDGIDSIPPSIKDLSKLIELRVCDCKNLKALPQLPLSLGHLDAIGCKSLETVATSQSAIIQAHWKDYHVSHHKQFQFASCPSLDRNSRNSLMIESQIRVLRAAILSISKHEEISKLFNGQKPAVQICIPGNEIPEWFKYRSKKSSITFELPPNWHTNFIGFALCAVGLHSGGGAIYCKYSFRAKDKDHNRSLKFESNYHDRWRPDMTKGSHFSEPDDHVFIWYSHEDHHDYHDAFKVSFKFYLSLGSVSNKHTISDTYVKRCGIRLLYRKDVEKLVSRKST